MELLELRPTGSTSSERPRERCCWRVPDDAGVDLVVPPEVLDLGLVYLRATVSPRLGPEAARFEAFRRESGGPSAADDRASQLRELLHAMRRVVGWVYET
jgi:hypothetical protein